MELFKAHRQWATRPNDERFSNLGDLYAATSAYARTAVEADVDWSELRALADGEDVKLVGESGTPATLTNYAFKQLAARVGAPAEYLSKLSTELAAQNLNYGLDSKDNAASAASVLIHRNGSMLVRAITSDRYARIWNHEVVERVLTLQEQGWEPARPDSGSTRNPSVMGGVDIENVPNAALYASDHDMFVFMRSKNDALEINPKGLAPAWRGIIAENSEVGAGALRLTGFLYNAMCGNHIIWGASELAEISLRHVGRAHDRMDIWEGVLKRYAESSLSDEQATIESAQKTRIADTKDGVLDKLFGIRSLGIPRKTLELGYDAVVPEQDGDPRTVWGMVQGLTRHSQTIPFADKRNDLDRAAGRILEKVRF